MVPKEFGARVQEQRIREGWSQEELADKVGISRNYLSQIERGQATNLSWRLVERLTTVLGVPLEEPETQTDWSKLPPSLKDFAEAASLPEEDVLMLARLQYRGQQPDTADKWKILYEIIKLTSQ